MKTVEQVLEDKGHAVLSVGPDGSVYDAVKLMSDADVGALLVLEGDQLVGIFSERDYARKVILFGKSSRETLVRAVMTEKLVCVRPTTTINECMAIMTEKRIRHLPVLDGSHVVGVISIGDAVKETIADQQMTIEQLKSYIMR